MTTPNLTRIFDESCDPQTYIPRRAGEELLRSVGTLIRNAEAVMVLHGPAGIGKTMLLKILRERFEDQRRVAYVSIGEPPEPELCDRILDLLAEPSADDPAQALIRAANAASDGQPRLLLLIDHANLAPLASSLQLVSAAREATPNLSVIFAVADEQGADEFARSLAAEATVTTLSFNQPMDPQEASAYVRLRLARSQIPAELRSHLDADTLRWLSEGAQAALPREINRRAAELLKSFEENGSDRRGKEASDELTTPATSGDTPMNVNEPPPPFPTSASSSTSRPENSSGRAVAAPPRAGSLGGMLLGHRPGAASKFKIDLELGRSLGSGLLESGSAEMPSHPPPPPTLGEPAKQVKNPRAPNRVDEPPASAANYRRLLALASAVVLMLVGAYWVVSHPSAIEFFADLLGVEF